MKNNNNCKMIDELIRQDKERITRIYKFITKGVKIIDPFTTHIGENVKIGADTVVYPSTIIESDVKIGKGCTIGPFARIRKGVTIKNDVTIGNFVEIVRSVISNGSKVKHLTYIGDAFVEEDVNIGAGTIVANYDGKNKHRTLIKKGAFIGSGSILVAPVRVGRKAMTGAGSVVTRNKHVPDGGVVVGVPARLLNKK
ncbi:MAG: DapH/DapD/GlmU-related protein [Candidatus Omnitrophota bacterium]|jgi:bifunctional UDP-N-acetylglucosamine pyrophosphorylase/glucosamine-1-phosphate N-acetyltransferase